MVSTLAQTALTIAAKITPDQLLNIIKLLSRGLVPQVHHSLYEVLDYATTLELCDPEGRTAIYRKQQKVKFLQNSIIAYQDEAWGDGDIFIDYQCSPGRAVDWYTNGNTYHILISLRETKNRGDIENFFITRRIQDGFTQPRQYFQNRINHPMRNFSTRVIFPVERPPRNLTLIEHHRNRTQPLKPEQIRTLPDGRIEAFYETTYPRLHDVISIRWDW